MEGKGWGIQSIDYSKGRGDCRTSVNISIQKKGDVANQNEKVGIS